MNIQIDPVAQPINTIESDSQTLLPQKDPAFLAENEIYFTQNTQNSLINTMKLDVVEDKLNTNFYQGLSEESAQTRLLRFGKNTISELQQPRFWRELFYEIFTNLSSLLAILGSLACILIYAFSSDNNIQILFAILVVLLLQIFLNASTVWMKRKNKSMIENTKEHLSIVCLVLRGGEKRFIKSDELVVGDIIFIREGELIQADILMIESIYMTLDSSALTGEVNGVKIDVNSIDKNIFESRNMVFYGCKCEEGYGKGIVIATGNRTFLGQFSQFINNISEKSKLVLEMNSFERWICFGSFVFSLAACMMLKFRLEYSTTFAIIFSIILASNALLAISNSRFSIQLSMYHSINSLNNNSILVTSQNALENVSFMSVLLAEKTTTLSSNFFTVKSLYFNQQLYSAEDLQNLNPFEKDSFIANTTFQELHKAGSLCGETVLDSTGILNFSQSYENCPIIANGESTDMAFSRFFSSMTMQETSDFRNSFEFAAQPNRFPSKKRYTGKEKFVVSIIKQQTETSYYTLYMKGPPEYVLNRCCQIMTEGNKTLSLTPKLKQKIIEVQQDLHRQGWRILAFAKLSFNKSQFPNGFRFNTACASEFNFRFEDLTFLGFISFYDPPKSSAQHNIEILRAEQLKIIMVSNDFDLTCQSFAREINFIPKEIPTNIDLQNDPSKQLTYPEAILQSSAVVAKFPDYYEFDQLEEFADTCIQKDFCVFARLQQKYRQIIIRRLKMNKSIIGLLGTLGSQFEESNSIRYSFINEAENIQKPNQNSIYRIRGPIDEKHGDFIGMKGQLCLVEESIQQGIHIRKNMVLTLEQTITISICCYLSVLICGFMKIPLSLSIWSVSVFSVITTILSQSSITKLNPLQQKYCLQNTTSIIKSSFLRSFRISAFAIGAGFICFFICFNQLGFASDSLLGMISLKGYLPPIDDFIAHLNPSTQQQDYYINKNLPFKCASEQNFDFNLQWSSSSQSHYDLRKALVNCNQNSGTFQPALSWSSCKESSFQASNSEEFYQHVCFSTEALNWCQSSFFAGIVLFAIFNMFISQTKNISCFSKTPTLQMGLGIAVSIILSIVLLLCSDSISSSLGARPLPFLLFGISALSICMLFAIFEEFRKYLRRRHKWFFKNSY